jgi:hypothetical protein
MGPLKAPSRTNPNIQGDIMQIPNLAARALAWAAASLTVAALAGCGGGGGGGIASASGGGGISPTAAAALSGVAATGGPITGGGSGTMNGVVTLKDSSSPAKTVTTATDGTGHYAFTSAQLQGLTPPFMLQIQYKLGGVGYSLASAATAADLASGSATIDITPLTDLVIANLGHQLAATIFANGNYASLLTPTALSAGVTALDNELQPILQQQGVSGSVDLLHQAFTANGTGLDAVLDSLHVTIDPSTGSEILTNTTTGQSVSGTLSNPPSTPLPAGSTNNVSDLQAITTTFNNLSALLATAPSATSSALLSYFDPANFLQDGQTLNAFLQNVTTQPKVIGGGLTFSNIELLPVPARVTTVPSGATAYKVVFTVLENMEPNSRTSFIVYKDAQGSWLALGNQKIARAAIMSTNASVTGALCAGLDVEINDKGAIGLTYAVVTGPQLPSGGALYFATGNGGPMQLAAGGPGTYAGTATQTLQSTMASGCSQSIAGQVVPFSDTQIGAISVPTAYTIRLYTGSNPATDTPVATYQPTLTALPLTSSQASAADFASGITATPSPKSLLTSGGSSTVDWSAPSASGLYANNLDLYGCANVPGLTSQQCSNYNVQLVPGQVSATVSIQAAPSGSTFAGGGMQLTYLDSLFRQYWTSP